MNVLPKRIERILVTPLAIVVGAVALGGCGKQSPQTQAAIRRILQPLMITTARDTVQLRAQRPDDCTTNTLPKDQVKISCQNSLLDSSFGGVEVIMRSKDGVADTSKPLYENIMTFSQGGDNNSMSGEDTDELIAPGGGKYAQNPTNPNDGWVAYSGGSTVIAEHSNANSGSDYDTTDPSSYSENPDGSAPSAAGTASFIVSVIEGPTGDLEQALSVIHGTH